MFNVKKNACKAYTYTERKPHLLYPQQQQQQQQQQQTQQQKSKQIWTVIHKETVSSNLDSGNS